MGRSPGARQIEEVAHMEETAHALEKGLMIMATRCNDDTKGTGLAGSGAEKRNS